MNKVIEQEVHRRAAGRCEYCHLPEALTKLKFTIDHIRARQHGGGDELDNLALACGYCNRHKGPNIASVDPASGQIARLFDPRSDRWTEHFRWEGTTIVGITPIGRATVVVLALNGRHQQSMRQALMDEGRFVRP
jgi:hypothetical protein